MKDEIGKNEEQKKTTLSELISKTNTFPIQKTDSNESDIMKEEDPQKTILDLKEKIFLLEKKNNDLKTKNENLTKNNVSKSALLMKMSLVGMRRGFASQSSFNQAQNDSIKLAEIIKEKDDLQEINEKMLDLLTDKEIENEDLREKMDSYKLETKLENEKYLERIKNLEEKIELLEESKGNDNNYEIDSIIHEYNNYKERLKRQINECIKNEGDLKEQLERKDRTIQKLNEEIQDLEAENLQLVNQSKSKDKINEKEDIEIEELKSENNKIRRELDVLGEKLKEAKENAKNQNKSHDEEIMEYQKKIESEQKYLKNYQENKSKEINSLKNEITKNNREINFFSKKIDLAHKMLDDEKQKNSEIQNKLDKKSKELQEMNEYTKKLLSNKDNILSQYEQEIEKMKKDKNELISQNKELLEKIKSNEGTNLAEIITEDNENNIKEDLEHFSQENKLFKEEIKSLKEQLREQAKNLVDINSLDKEIVRLKGENEILINDNKAINKKIEELKEKEEQALLESKKKELVKAIRSLRSKPILRSQPKNINYEKQLEALKKLKDDEKNDYEDQIKKLKMEIALLKLKNLKQQHKNDSLVNNYKNIIKAASLPYVKKYSIYIVGFILLIIEIKILKGD